MSEPAIFFEATFHATLAQQYPLQGWRDVSDTFYFSFESTFGSIRLRKRGSYPKTFAYVQGSCLYFGYGDLDRGYQALGSDLPAISESIFFNTEFFCCTADVAQQEVTMQRDALSTLPVFMSGDASNLTISNKYERIFALLPHKKWQTNTYALGELLLISMNPTALHTGLDVLCDRQRLIWSPRQGIKREYAPPSSFVDTVEDREVGGELFWEKLEYTLEQYWQRYGLDNAMAAELSGGLDTSVVDGYYRNSGRPLLLASVVHNNRLADTQLQKLADFSERFKTTVHKMVVDADKDYPLAPMVKSGDFRPFFHMQELYTEPIGRLAQYMEANNATAVLRGVGGNELFDNWGDKRPQPHETPLGHYRRTKPYVPSYLTPNFVSSYEEALESAPRPIASLLPLQVAAAAPGGNNPYIDYNIWPIMPLADPQLYLFCQTLPIRYRANRNIMRAYMQARKFPPSIYNPIQNEGFSDFFYTAARAHLTTPFKQFMRHSVLAQAGLVDAAKAMQMWEEAFTEHFDPGGRDNLFDLYCLLTAEINLQTAHTYLA